MSANECAAKECTWSEKCALKRCPLNGCALYANAQGDMTWCLNGEPFRKLARSSRARHLVKAR